MEQMPKKQSELPEEDISNLAKAGHDIERLETDISSVQERLERADEVIGKLETDLSAASESQRQHLYAEIDSWKSLRADMKKNVADYQRMYEAAKLLRQRFLDDLME